MASAAQMAPDFSMKQVRLADGDRGIAQTIREMQKLVTGIKGVGSALVRGTALKAVRGSVRNVTELQALFSWVKRNIDFRGEAEETLQSPEATLNFGAGDCDDIATLLAAMAASIGYEWAFKTVAVAREAPNDFSHVYAMAKDKITGQWIALDTTVKRAYPGWEPDDITRQQMYRSQPMGRLGRMGDDATTIDTDIVSPVPIPVAPTGLSPDQSLLYNFLEPLDQAGASLIAHGQTPSASVNVNGLGLTGTSSLPLLLLAGGVVLLVVFLKK